MSERTAYHSHLKTAFFVLFGMIMFTALPSANAQSTDPKSLQTIQQQQKKAEQQAAALNKKQSAVKKDVARLKRNLVEATAQSRGVERDVSDLRSQLDELYAQEQGLKSTYQTDQTALIDLLASLQRIERTPPPSLLTHPQNALDAVRTAHLMSSLSRTLQERSDELAQTLRQLNRLQNTLSGKRVQYTNNATELDRQLKSIKSTISNKASLQKKLSSDQKSKTAKAKTLAKKAKNLRDLIEKLEEQAGEITPRLKPNNAHSIPSPHLKPSRKAHKKPVRVAQHLGRFADARGTLSLPVLGKLVQKFGARTKTGARTKGMVFRTGPKAQLVAPFDGRVEFSGSFNDDVLIIINVGNGYFIILTGLGETFVRAGEHIDGGEPIGLMPAKTSKLFMEFRKNKSSIDPMPWIGHNLGR